MLGPIFGNWTAEIPGYGPRLLAHIDLLGWEELTRKPDASTLDRVASCQHLIEKSLRGAAVSRSQPGWSMFESQYSDTVVFSCVPTPTEASALIERTRDFCAMLLYEGLHLTRGGIALGNARHDAGAVFGPAVIEAYRLEKTAAYPRILVSDGAAPLLAGATRDDFDGLRFLDIFQSGYSGLEWGRSIRTAVEAELARTRDLAKYSDPATALNHRAKYGWVLRHIDAFLAEE